MKPPPPMGSSAGGLGGGDEGAAGGGGGGEVAASSACLCASAACACLWRSSAAAWSCFWRSSAAAFARAFNSCIPTLSSGGFAGVLLEGTALPRGTKKFSPSQSMVRVNLPGPSGRNSSDTGIFLPSQFAAGSPAGRVNSKASPCLTQISPVPWRIQPPPPLSGLLYAPHTPSELTSV